MNAPVRQGERRPTEAWRGSPSAQCLREITTTPSSPIGHADIRRPACVFQPAVPAYGIYSYTVT